jgi:RHS repeat-associated protein
MKSPLLFLFAAGMAVALHAETYVVPVVTARMRDATYSTTTGFRNDSKTDVTCRSRYVRADGKVLSAVYTLPAGATMVEPDTLLEVAAVGTMQLDCSGELAIASRIQSSKDDGLTFDGGSVFAAGRLRMAVTPAKSRTIKTGADLLVLEPDGNEVRFTVVVKDISGTVFGRRAYQISGYTQQRVDMEAVRNQIEGPQIDIQVASGRVVVLVESREVAIAKLAPEVTYEQRIIAAKNASATATPPDETKPSITELLLICPFKAAPFRDPATGLCFMRDRWYDPSTGTFLTPDPEGYTDSSNLYAYCKNDPVNCSDPTGRSATVVGGLLGAIGGSGYTIYRSVRHGDPFTWRYIAQGTLSGAAIGFGIDTLGAGSGLSASVLGGTAIGAGGGGAFASIQSGGDWGAYGKGTLKGGVLGGISGGTGYGISAAGLGGGWAFAGSVAADTYAGVGIDYAFGDATNLSDTVASNAIGSVVGNTLGYGSRLIAREIHAGMQFRMPRTHYTEGLPGATMPNGDMYLMHGLSPAQKTEMFLHESVHQFFSAPPLGGSLTSLSRRQQFGQWARANSHFVRYLDEVLAESYKVGRLTGSPFRGISAGVRYPIIHRAFYELNPWRIGIEGAGYGLLPFGAYGISSYIQDRR